MNGDRTPNPNEENSSMGRGKPLESTVQTSLDSMGISLLSEWDVLAFVYRHGASLASSDQIARLIGYESTVVRAALDRLESENLIERSPLSKGVRFYRILASTDAGRQRRLQQIVSLSETRVGRLLLAKRLKPRRVESGQKEQSNKLTIE
jgi:DNA-binding MarR family transcriptional regulator